MLEGIPQPIKLESRHMTFTESVCLKTAQTIIKLMAT
jgi:hypothetical protein